MFLPRNAIRTNMEGLTMNTQVCKKYLRTFFLTAMCAALFAATAFAANSATNWEDATITVTGIGVPPANTVNAAQAKGLAKRAAVVDGYRQLAEAVKGVSVDSESTVENMMVLSDTTKTRVQATIQGARILETRFTPDGGCEVTMQVSIWGVSGSLASAVFEETKTVEQFPEPVANVAPAEPNVNVNVTVNTGNTTVTPPAPPATPKPSTGGSSAAPAPAGRAIGNFTGLIVDCRGLNLRPVMSPVIKNDQGSPIYGYKNLDSKKVIHNGMAGYTREMSMSAASRAGSNPLVVKAVAVENHNGNPVVSVADANRILIENRASGFLDNCAVVFVR